MKHTFSGLIKTTLVSAIAVALISCGGAEERKEKYLEKSKSYIAQNNFDKAKVELKNVLQIDPKYADAYYYMGQVEENNKELLKAIGNYRKAIELDPLNTKSKVKLSRIYIIAGTDETMKEASRLLDEVNQEDPDNLEAELSRSFIEFKNGDKSKGIAAIEAVIQKDNSMIEGVIILANIYVKNNQYEKARDLLLQATKDNPENIIIKKELAGVYSNQLNDVATAEKYLLEMESIDPENYTIKLWLSSFYARTDQIDKAENILRKGLEQDKDDAKRYLMLVELIASRVGYEDGIRELESAIKDRPDLYELQFAKADILTKTGSFNEAKSTLKKIISDHSYSVEGVTARVQMAKILLDEGDQEGASVHVEEVLSENPDNVGALLISSKLSLMDFNADDAINDLRSVLKYDPKNVEATLLLSQAYEFNGQSSLAEDELKKSIEANPVNEDAHVNYARYLADKGRVEESKKVINKALTYFKSSYDLLDLKLRIEISKGNDSEVLVLLDSMEQADSDNPEVNLIRGKYYLSKSKNALSIDQFELALKKSSDKYTPLKYIVQSYLDDKKPEAAMKRLSQAQDESVNEAIVYQLKGLVYGAQGKVDDAKEMFLKASDSQKDWMRPYTSLAAAYLSSNDIQGAINVYKGSLKNLDDKVPAQISLASLYERDKQYKEAMKIYSDILNTSPLNKVAANNYASLLLDFGEDSDVTKALKLVSGFEKIKQPALHDTLGWAYAKSGDNQKAINILKPIVEQAPNVAVFRYHLGYALYHTGEKAAAKSHLEIAVDSDQEFPGKIEAEALLKEI